MFIQLIIKASGAGNKAQRESGRKKDKWEIADICDYVWKFNYLIKANVAKVWK